MTTENYGVTGKRAGVAGGGLKVANKESGAPSVRHAFIYYLRFIGLRGIWILLILVLGPQLFNLIFNAPLIPYTEYPLIFVNACFTYLLAMGIVMPNYLETLLSFGFTRTQNAHALLLTGTLATLVFTFVSVLIDTLCGEFDLLWSLQTLTGNWLAYLVGWFMVIGYQYRHILTAGLSTGIGFVLYVFVASRGDTFVSLSNWAHSTLGPVGSSVLFSGICLALSLVLLLAIIPLTRRISIKV